MRRLLSSLLAGLVGLAPVAARADRGALSLDAAAGGVATAVPAVGVEAPKSTVSFDGSFWVGTRYALSNRVELSASGFFEPPATVFQNDVRLVTDSGVYPGTTRHTFTRFGAQAGARAVFGMVVRLHLGLELGWAQQLYTGQQHFDVTSADGAVDYGLALPDESRASLVVSPVLGLEWCGGDAWSLAVMPRAQVLLGATVSWALVVPLQFSWSWYL